MSIICLSSPAYALEGEWASADESQMRIISGVDSVSDTDTIKGAVEIRLTPGWHTYWRTSGDTGLPPSFDWSGSSNVDDVQVHYPFPVRFDEYGLTTLGYKGGVTLPFDLKVTELAKDTDLKLKADILVCNEICIPQSIEASLSIPAGDGQISRSAKMIDFAYKKVPEKETTPNLKIENVVFGADRIVVSAMSKRDVERLDAFVEIPEINIVSVPDIQAIDDSDMARLIISVPDSIGSFLEEIKGKDIRITLTNGREAVEKIISFEDDS